MSSEAPDFPTKQTRVAERTQFDDFQSLNTGDIQDSQKFSAYFHNFDKIGSNSEDFQSFVVGETNDNLFFLRFGELDNSVNFESFVVGETNDNLFLLRGGKFDDSVNFESETLGFIETNLYQLNN